MYICMYIYIYVYIYIYTWQPHAKFMRCWGLNSAIRRTVSSAKELNKNQHT